MSGAARAQTDSFNGGGSSLAAKVYIAAGQVYAGGTPNFDLTYGTSSSGNGTTAFINNSFTLDYPNGGAPSGNVDFAASDAFLTTSNQQAIANALGGLQPIQIPMFATAVAIAYNLPGYNTDGALAFTDNDLGLIFSGQVTNFNDARLSMNSPTVTLPNQAITVVYRSDGSGTSNLFTTHLANALTPTPAGSGTGHFYAANFAQGSAYPQNTNNAVVPTVAATGTNNFNTIFAGGNTPSGFVGASGSGGVQSVITSTTGAIGYLSPDYTDIAPINSGSAGYPPVATVNGVLPTSANTATAFNGLTLPSTVAQLQNQQNFAPLVPIPPSGSYPIVGFTYWFLSPCYVNATQSTDIKAFLATYFTNLTYAGLIQLNGFAQITGATSYESVIAKYVLKNTAATGGTANIDIGDSQVCTSGKGR